MNSNYQFGFRRRLSPGIRGLIIANVVIYLLGMFSPTIRQYMVVFGGLIPEYFTQRFFLWQPVTYMFLHGNLSHIFFNMFALWMFGSELENAWGTRFFLKYYFVTGILAGILSAVVQPMSTIPIIGASGAIYGILLGFALMYPNRIVYFNFLFPIKVKYFVAIFAGIELFSSLGNSGYSDGVAHFTHLSGMIFGYLYLWLLQHKNRFKGFRFPKISLPKSRTKDFRKKPQNKSKNDKQEFNRLMDKVADSGYNSLSEDEQVHLLELTRKFGKN